MHHAHSRVVDYAPQSQRRMAVRAFLRGGGGVPSQVGVSSMDELITKTVPSAILLNRPLDLGAYSPGLAESDALDELKGMVSENKVSALRVRASTATTTEIEIRRSRARAQGRGFGAAARRRAARAVCSVQRVAAHAYALMKAFR